MISQTKPPKTFISLFVELFTLSQTPNHRKSGKTPEPATKVSSSSSTSSSSIDWVELSKSLEPSAAPDCVFEQFDSFLVPSFEVKDGTVDKQQTTDKMIMEGLDTITQVTLSEPQHFSLSFDSYKPLSDSDDNPSPARSVTNEPATAGERTPGSPGSATGTGDNTNISGIEDTLNTPVSTSSDLPAFFSIVTSIPDAVPITGMAHILIVSNR